MHRDDRTGRLDVVRAVAATNACVDSLFRARVSIHTSASVLESPNGWVLVKTLVQLVARTAATTVVVLDSTPGQKVSQRLDALATLLTWHGAGGTQRVAWQVGGDVGAAVTCVVGTGQPYAQSPACYVGASAWQGAVSTAHSLDVRPSASPWGALVAACLGASGVLRALIEVTADGPVPQLGSSTPFVALDLWRLAISTAAPEVEERDPSVRPRALSDLHVVGAGAVANGFAWALAHCPELRGTLAWWDDDVIDESSMNRCIAATPEDINVPKVRILERLLRDTGFVVEAHQERWTAASPISAGIISTVDDNTARHLMQEALPQVLFQAATHDSSLVVSRHTAVDGRSCLICRHPERSSPGGRMALSVSEAAEMLGLEPRVLASGEWEGQRTFTGGMARQLAARVPAAADALNAAAERGQDVCGVLGELRERFGHQSLPPSASVGFASILAGVILAGELVKGTSDWTGDAPVLLDNVLQLDLLADVPRQAALFQWREPPRRDCALCQERAAMVRRTYVSKWGSLD